MIIELRSWTNPDQQIDELPAGRGFGERQPRDAAPISLGFVDSINRLTFLSRSIDSSAWGSRLLCACLAALRRHT